MPGPGGGGRSGGGGRGGFSGGSHGGSFGGGSRGGFGGGHHGGFHGGGFHGTPPMGGGWHYRSRPTGCGGCLNNLVGTVILVILLITFLIYMLMPSNSVSVTVGDSYSEEQFQDYADGQYAAHFSGSAAYEDNLLLTVLVDEDYYNYYYIAWVGDHIAADINYMMGDNDTELGRTMNSCISDTSYKYSLDSDLAQVMYSMTEQIQTLGLESSYICDENHSRVQSRLTNYSNISMTEDTVNTALTAFTEATGIPVVIVVEDMQDVFGGSASGDSSESSGISLAWVLVLVVGAVVVIAFVIRSNRRRRDVDDDFTTGNTDYRYRDFDE